VLSVIFDGKEGLFRVPLCSDLGAAESAPAADSAALAGVPPPVPKEFPAFKTR